MKTLVWVVLGVCAAFTVFVMGFMILLVGFRPEDESVHYYRELWIKQAAEPQTPRWFPDGQRIAFSYKGGVYVVDSAGSQVQLIDGGGGGLDLAYAPSVSPSGTRIAYFAYTQPKGGLFGDNYEGWDTFTANPDGTDKRRLNDVGRRRHAWSPDGGSIAFEGPGYQDIGVTAADGSGLRTVASLEEWTDVLGAPAGAPAWSPDGGSIAFATYVYDDPDSYYVRVVGLDGSRLMQTQVQGKIERSPVWSPDGGHLALTTVDSDGPENFYVYVLGVNGSGSRKTQMEGKSASPPAWSPAGDRIALLKLDDGSTKLYTFYPDGSDILEVADSGLEPDGDAYFFGTVSWFQDGSQMIFLLTTYGSSIEHPYVVNADGSELRTFENWSFNAAALSPDGSRIASLITGRRGVVLYSIASDGNDSQLLVELDGNGNPSPAHGRPIGSEW